MFSPRKEVYSSPMLLSVQLGTFSEDCPFAYNICLVSV